jgi:TorA maturation chaperone TorD
MVTPTAQHLRLLAALLAAPADDGLEAAGELAQANPWLLEAIGELETLPLDQWQGEHTRLFLSDFPTTTCPPFESAFRHGLMEGSATVELEALYRGIGLESRDVPADYLGVMLECVAWLLEQPEPEREPHLGRLWNDHLAQWLPRFSGKLREESRLILYRNLGEQLAMLFPREDKEE